MKKSIICHCLNGESGSVQRSEHNARWQIKRLKAIIDRFRTDDGFDEFCNLNTIGIYVGSAEYSAETYFCPETWEAVHDAILYIICHLIEVNELDRFPYYEQLISEYSGILHVDRGNFVN